MHWYYTYILEFVHVRVMCDDTHCGDLRFTRESFSSIVDEQDILEHGVFETDEQRAIVFIEAPQPQHRHLTGVY